MEKISRIIPSNARVTTVDMKNSGVARSGTPGFGREQGMSSVARREMEKDRLNIKDPTTLQKAMNMHNEAVQARESTADMQAKSIQDLADKFFLKRKTEIENNNPLNESMNAELVSEELEKTDLPDEAVDQVRVDVEMAEGANESEEAPVVGKNLDVQA